MWKIALSLLPLLTIGNTYVVRREAASDVSGEVFSTRDLPACAAAWTSYSIYVAGNVVSENSVNYVANWWTQGNDPSQNSGGAGSGQPWAVQGPCAGTTPTPTPTCAAAWDVSSVYNTGNVVSENNVNYIANWWTQGDDPSTHSGGPNAGDPWSVQGLCKGASPPGHSSPPTTCATAWEISSIYVNGDVASENGINYVANWWTQGDDPSTHSGGPGSGQPWTKQASCTGTVIPPATACCVAYWDASTVYVYGDNATENNFNYMANWWTEGEDPSTHSGGPGSGQPWTKQAACTYC